MAPPLSTLYYLNVAKNQLHANDFGELHQKINAGDVQFCYAPVTYQQFKSVYRSGGWQFRKVEWILGTPVLLVIAVTALAGAALCLLFQSTSKARCCLFTAIRLCESLTGELICIFNDRIGSYLIQDGGMHVKFYLSRARSQEEFVKSCLKDITVPPAEPTLVTIEPRLRSHSV